MGDPRLYFGITGGIESDLIQFPNRIREFPLRLLIETVRTLQVQNRIALSAKRHALELSWQENRLDQSADPPRGPRGDRTAERRIPAGSLKHCPVPM